MPRQELSLISLLSIKRSYLSSLKLGQVPCCNMQQGFHYIKDFVFKFRWKKALCAGVQFP